MITQTQLDQSIQKQKDSEQVMNRNKNNLHFLRDELLNRYTEGASSFEVNVGQQFKRFQESCCWNMSIGILIVLLYFLNYHICELVFPNNIDKWWDLKVSILSIMVVLSINYKPQNNFIEKLFISIIINNIYVLLKHNEISYSSSDAAFIIIFTLLQHVASTYRKHLHNNS